MITFPKLLLLHWEQEVSSDMQVLGLGPTSAQQLLQMFSCLPYKPGVLFLLSLESIYLSNSIPGGKTQIILWFCDIYSASQHPYLVRAVSVFCCHPAAVLVDVGNTLNSPFSTSDTQKNHKASNLVGFFFPTNNWILRIPLVLERAAQCG